MAHPLPSPSLEPEPARPPTADGLWLCELKPGERGLIDHIDRKAVSFQRLLALGFAPGSEVQAIRRAPLGDPVEYQVRGTRICLRQTEASLIRIRVLDDM